MSAGRTHFEVVCTDAGYHGRFRADNGEIVWTTEVYTRREPVWEAIHLLRKQSEFSVPVEFSDERTVSGK